MDPVLPGTIAVEAATVRRALNVAAMLVLVVDRDPDRDTPDDRAARRVAAALTSDLGALLTAHEVTTLDRMLRADAPGAPGAPRDPSEG